MQAVSGHQTYAYQPPAAAGYTTPPGGDYLASPVPAPTPNPAPAAAPYSVPASVPNFTPVAAQYSMPVANPNIPAPAAGPTAQGGDPFVHLRGAPMFRLSMNSDTPYHTTSINRSASQITGMMKLYKSVITRWAAPGGGPSQVVVDVYQLLNPISMGTSPFSVQVSRDCHVILGGRFHVQGCRGRVFRKHWTRQHIEEVALIIDGAVVPLGIVERNEERVAPEESENVKKRFRSWSVPA